MTWLRPPSLLKRLTRMIEEREHNLIDAHMQVEAAIAYADQIAAQLLILQGRVEQLRPQQGVDSLGNTRV
jgi:hypothetical protein